MRAEDLESISQEVLESVDSQELMVFSDYVEDRVINHSGYFPESDVQNAIEDVFIRDEYDLGDEKLAEVLEIELKSALEDYESGRLFQLEVPGYEEPFNRVFWRHKSEEGSSHGFKEFYRSSDGSEIALIPKPKFDRTTRRQAEQVVSWVHGAETIVAEGLSIPNPYRVTAVERDGKTVPGVISEYNDEMVLASDMTEEQWSEAQRDIAEASAIMTNLVVNGEFASSKINDYYGAGTSWNQAYNFETGEVIVPDMGELYDPFFRRDIVPHNSRQDFLEYHNLDRRALNLMEAYDFD